MIPHRSTQPDVPKRLHVFDRRSVPAELRGLVGDKIRENTVIANWPDVLRCIATMLSGRMKPSQLLKKLAARPRQHDLAIALREIGRVERTLFIIEWALDTDMQRRANIGGVVYGSVQNDTVRKFFANKNKALSASLVRTKTTRGMA